MNLEHELRALPIAFPDEPDLAPRVLARIERPVRRWWLVPALVALAVAGALFAIPQTRAAILDLFRIGDVEVRREQGIVLKAGVELNLTKTEFRLICEFADHAGAVLSRDQLLERVWGYEYLGDSRLVDAHVRRLRLKIEDHPDEPQLIVTARGVGYRLMTG